MLDIRFTVPTLVFALPAAAIAIGVVVVRSRRQATSLRPGDRTGDTTDVGVRLAWDLLTALYLVGLAAVAFFPFQVSIGRYGSLTPWWSSVNVVPLVTLGVTTFVLNIVMFVPLGVVLAARTRFDTLGRVIAVGALVSLGIELAQIAFNVMGGTRTGDVDDLLANTAGAAVGFAVFAVVRHRPLVRRLVPAVPARH